MHIQSWQITGNGFHFGRHGLGQEETSASLPSDSLFAALVYRLAEGQGQAAVEDFMVTFLESEPPFVLSSTFPFAGQVRFFPTPLQSPSGKPPGREGLRPKDLKKVQFISESLFRRLLAGESLVDLYPESVKLQDGAVLAERADLERLPEAMSKGEARLWAVELRPRVTLGRAAQNSSIFFTGRVVFAQECGLWFGIGWQSGDQALKQLVNSLIMELAETGLGGERSVGFGACQMLETGKIQLPEARQTLWVSLSRYLPRKDEMSALLHPQARYGLVNVGGWLDSPVRRGQRRRVVNLVIEGSVLGSVERAIPGQVVDVRPRYKTDQDPLGHAVYRCGLAFPVGIQGGEA